MFGLNKLNYLIVGIIIIITILIVVTGILIFKDSAFLISKNNGRVIKQTNSQLQDADKVKREKDYKALLRTELKLKSGLEKLTINPELALQIKENDLDLGDHFDPIIAEPDYSQMTEASEISKTIRGKLVKYLDTAIREQTNPSKDMANKISHFMLISETLSHYCKLSTFDSSNKKEWSENILNIKLTTLQLAEFLHDTKKREDMKSFLENAFTLEQLRTCF